MTAAATLCVVFLADSLILLTVSQIMLAGCCILLTGTVILPSDSNGMLTGRCFILTLGAMLRAGGVIIVNVFDNFTVWR